MNRWQLFVGLLLAFLFIPQKARAECAWVLWAGNGPAVDLIMGAFETLAECQVKRDAGLKNITDPKDPGKLEGGPFRVGDMVTYTDHRGKIVYARLTCLPGTLDPRPRK